LLQVSIESLRFSTFDGARASRRLHFLLKVFCGAADKAIRRCVRPVNSLASGVNSLTSRSLVSGPFIAWIQALGTVA
jgi:hypothetical protein